MTELYPMKIRPRYVERIWGGHHLKSLLGKPAPKDQPIGESWEIFEENPVENGPYVGRSIGELRQSMGADLMGHVPADQLFPLLTKVIDATDVLSVQVHPDDRFAREHEHQPYGKTECWYVIHVEPGAEMTYGFAQDSDPQEYERLVADGQLETILRQLPVQGGDVLYLPAGMVHAIGAGIVLYELQQTSDVTYRIYDWNRVDASGKPRELHVEQASQVLNYHRITRGAIYTLHLPDTYRTLLIAGQYFAMEKIKAGEPVELATGNSPVAVFALHKPVRVECNGQAIEMPAYSSALIPAGAKHYTIAPASSEDFAAFASLVAYVPASSHTMHQDLLERGISETDAGRFLQQFAPLAQLGQGATQH